MIVIASPTPPDPPLCNACLTVPGWFRYPEIREAIDPEGWASPPEEAAE